MNHPQNFHAEEQLEDALAMLAAGIPPETILQEAGPDADWLRPLLETAGKVAQLQAAVPIPSPEASLQTMLAHGRKLAQPPRPKNSPLAGWRAIFNPPRLAGSFRGALVAVSLVTAFLAGTVLGGGLTLAAQESLPGQRFYGLKRMSESIQLGFAANRDQLLQTYNRRRRFEAELLLLQGQRVMVAFEDRVQGVTDQAITIHGFTVQLGPDTIIAGDLVPGSLVHLEAITQPPEALLAIKIVVIQPGPATPTPSPTLTALPSPTATATPTPSTAQDADTLALPPPIPTDDMPPPLDEPPDIDADPSPAPAPADDNDNVPDDFDNDNFDDDLDNEPDEDFDDDDNKDDGDNSNSGSDDGDNDNSNDNDGDNDNDDDNSNDNDDDNNDNDGDDNSGKSSSDDEDKSGKSSDDDDDKS